jgi:hypothetical protein
MALSKERSGMKQKVFLMMQRVRRGTTALIPEQRGGLRDPLTFSLTARLESWLSTLIETHTPTSTPPSSATSPNGPMNNLDIALVVTHEECLLALLNILTHQPSPVQVSIAAGVDVGARVENATFAIVRVWWEKEDKEEGLVPRGRLEAWAVGGLLQD